MKRFSIKYQILLIAMIPVFLIDVFFTYVHVNSSIRQAEQLLQSKGEIIARQIAGASEFNLFSGSYSQIQYLLDQSINTNDIIFAAVYDAQGQPVAKAEGNGYQAEFSTQYFYYRQPILTENMSAGDVFEPQASQNGKPVRSLGWVHLYISREKLLQNKLRILVEGALFFCAMLIIAVLLTLLISRRITRPVFTLLEHLKEIETGKLGNIIQQVESNEIGDVQKGFNSMSQSLLANRMQLDQKIKTATLELMNAITDLEYKNRELAVARDVAQNANQIKSQFLANMSHEIRTPINGINGFVNLLSQTGLNQDQKRYVDIISQSTEDLSVIINEILDFSKIESGKVEIINNPFDLYELIETTRDSLFAGTIGKDIDLHLTIYSDTPRMVIGDKLRLKQILINLIGNAIKFTEHGFVAITVYLDDSSQDQDLIRFKIEDSGIGITEDDQKTLFQAFKQIESDTNRRYSGTGLGLVISRNLAALMGGDILLKSEPNQGSLFTLILPFKPFSKLEDNNPFAEQTAMIYASNQRCLNEIQSLYNRVGYLTEVQFVEDQPDIEDLRSRLKQNLPYIDLVVFDLRHSQIKPQAIIDQTILDRCPAIIMHYDLSLIDRSDYPGFEFVPVINTCRNLTRFLQHAESEPAAQASDTIQVSTKPKKILLVDDNPINLALASELTRLWGHHAYEASHAEQAMTLFRVQQYDLILLDIQMPEIDGIELMRMMRREQPELSTPIVAITANIMELEGNRLLKMGFDAYISKPIDENKLKHLLEQDVLFVQDLLSSNDGPDPKAAVDYRLTLQLAANNEALVKDIFNMLREELPQYQHQLAESLAEENIERIEGILHKLHGITCYSGLPYLKHLLHRYESVKREDPQQVRDISSEIISELKRIGDTLENL